MLVITIMLTPIHGVIADEPTNETIDVSVTHLSYTSGCAQTDEPFTIITNITNNGNRDATNFTVAFTDKDTNITLYKENITLLQAEATTTLMLKWNATISNHTIIVTADMGNNIVETSEDNNQDETLLLPGTQNDAADAGQQPMATYPTTWREAESWDRSYDTNSGGEWDILSYSTASNEEYTRQQNVYYNGDYAEWDFTVYDSGTYYFWVRHWVDNKGCDEVILQWNGDTIGSDSWYQFAGGNYWEWTCFGTKILSEGPGTLRLESQVWRFMETDNIAITADPSFTPFGTGVEGSTNHTIGYNNPPTANDDTASTDEDIPVWIDVLSNDYDSDGSLDPSTVTVTSDPSDGSTTVNTTTGDIKYTPDSGFYGTDSFTYTVDDNDGATSNTATVTISVSEVNDPPSLSNGHVNPESGSTVTLFTYWVSYSDPEGDSPNKKRVYIDGSPHTMVYDSTYSDGIRLYHKYKYQTTLSVGDHTYYFVFNDGYNPDVRLPVSGSYSGPSVLPANQPPTLVNHGTIPVGGDTSTVFTYRLTYTDAEGDAPTKKKVYIDDEGFDMTKVGGDYMTGAAYNYETTLPAGDHTYYFVFNDGNNPDVRLPVGTGTYSGPHVQGDNPEISFNDYTVDDDYNGDSFGSNNSLVEGGETIELLVTLENTGSDVANNVTANLSTDDSLITITDEHAEFGTIPAGGTADGVFVFEVDISHCDESVVFSLDIEDENGSTWTDSFTVDVYECPGLNYQYVKNVTYELSRKIFTAYDVGDIQKGRAFGTKGEHAAAYDIKTWMNNLSYFDSVIQDPLNGGEAKKLEIISKELLVNDGSGYESVECFITPKWRENNTVWDKLLPPPTCSFSYNDLTVEPRPDFSEYDNFTCFIVDILTVEIENGNITDYDSYFNYTTQEFQDYYEFTYENWTYDDCDTWPNFYDCENYYPQSGFGFVYIEEDQWNNPSSSLPDCLQNKDPFSDIVIFFRKAKLHEQMRQWAKNEPNCKGLILYDFNDHTHNMINYNKLRLPVIFINGTE